VFTGEVRLKLYISPASGPSLLVACSEAKLELEVDMGLAGGA